METTIDVKEIKRIIRDYFAQIHGNKSDNLNEKDNYLEKRKFIKFNQNRICRSHLPEKTLRNLSKVTSLQSPQYQAFSLRLLVISFIHINISKSHFFSEPLSTPNGISSLGNIPIP